MLEELTVQNFALLKDIHLTFDHGFNVLTGETGAGKSIIVDAMGLLLGERANVRDIRYGADGALVEGVFAVEVDSAVAQELAAQSFETAPWFCPGQSVKAGIILAGSTADRSAWDSTVMWPRAW